MRRLRDCINLLDRSLPTTRSLWTKMRKSGFEKRALGIVKRNGFTVTADVDKLEYSIPSTYTADFKIGDIYIETKGYFRPSDRRKMKEVKNSNPELDIRIWFQKDLYLNPKTKATTYTQWAEKHGFPYHVGEKFPEHWAEDMRNDALD